MSGTHVEELANNRQTVRFRQSLSDRAVFQVEVDDVQLSWVEFTVDCVLAWPMNVEVEEGVFVAAKWASGDVWSQIVLELNSSRETVSVVFVSDCY